MFFRKKKKIDTPVENVAKKGIKKMDAVVTGGILAGIIASIYGVKKLRDHRKEKETTDVDEKPTTPSASHDH